LSGRRDGQLIERHDHNWQTFSVFTHFGGPSMNDDNDGNTTPDDDDMFDRAAIEADAVEGAKALAYLFKHASDEWDRWEKIILGLRGLRDLAHHATGTRSRTDFAYRQEIARLLNMSKYAVYDRLSKQQRAACYKLMDYLDDISDWYYGRGNFQGYPITADDRLNWKSPETIVKHCPPQFLNGGESKRTKARPLRRPKAVPPAYQAEIDRLRRLVVVASHRLIEHGIAATDLLDQLQPPELETDSVHDV
jgi:hypothetical protein